MGKKKDVAEIVSNLGFAFELLKVIAQAVIDKGGNVDHLRRVVNEPELRSQVVELVIGAEKVQRGALRTQTFTAHVEYRVGLEELKKFFFIAMADFHCMDQIVVYPEGKELPKVKDDLTFEYVRLTQSAEPAEIVSFMEKNGLRPATRHELVGFAKAHPQEFENDRIIAIGEKINVFVCMDEQKRLCLRVYSLLERAFHVSSSWVFLAVRKETPSAK